MSGSLHAQVVGQSKLQSPHRSFLAGFFAPASSLSQLQATLLWRSHHVARGHAAQAGGAGGCQLGQSLHIHRQAVFNRAVEAVNRHHVGVAVHGLDARNRVVFGGQI